jgi:hypothetical protein
MDRARGRREVQVLLELLHPHWRRVLRLRKRFRHERAYWRQYELGWALILVLLSRGPRGARTRVLRTLAEPHIERLRNRRYEHY